MVSCLIMVMRKIFGLEPERINVPNSGNASSREKGCAEMQGSHCRAAFCAKWVGWRALAWEVQPYFPVVPEMAPTRRAIVDTAEVDDRRMPPRKRSAAQI